MQLMQLDRTATIDAYSVEVVETDYGLQHDLPAGNGYKLF